MYRTVMPEICTRLASGGGGEGGNELELAEEEAEVFSCIPVSSFFG